MSRVLSLNTPAFSGKIFRPVKLTGTERINQLYQYELVLKTPDMDNVEFFKSFAAGNPSAAADVTAWLGQDISVGIEIDSSITGSITGSGTRHISGIITGAQYLQQQRRGNFYSITIEPALAQANLRSDYKIYQDQNVIEILEELLKPYSITLDKRLSDENTRYPKRIYQTQFGETDFVFFRRLCSEWGINWYWEHTDGGHTLILADDSSSHKTMPLASYQKLNYYPPNHLMTIKEEYFRDFNLSAKMVSGAYSSRDYDYLSASTHIRDSQSNIQPYPEAQSKGQGTDGKEKNKNTPPEIAKTEHEIYEYAADIVQSEASVKQNSETIDSSNNNSNNFYTEEHASRNQWNLEREQQNHIIATGIGNIRGLSTGHTFNLNKHPNTLANRDWLVKGTELLVMDVMEESQRKADKLTSLLDIGSSTLSPNFIDSIRQQIKEQTEEQLETIKQAGIDKLLHGNQSWQIECRTELVPANINIRPGKQPKPKGTLQNALVVGEDSSGSIHTDELGRIKVQFYWDRYSNRDERSSCWVRVNEPWAGNQMGATFTPRIGQEVLIDYINNDPDLPVCIGKVNNSDNLPNWKLSENKSLSGFRSRELPSGNSASGRSNHLILDDTAGSIQAQLKSDHAHSQLSLGDITRIEDNGGRKDPRGQGFELRTDDWGSTRAAKGLYLTTFPRNSAESSTMDAEEAKQLLEEAKQLVKQLSKLATKHEADELTATEPLEEMAKVVQPEEAQTAQANQTENTEADSSQQPQGFSDNVLLGAGEGGIVLTTPRETHQYSSEQHSITTGNDLNITTGKSWLASIGQKMSLFVQEGIKVFSGKGKVQIEAHNNGMDIIADKTLKVISANDKIEIAAEKEILITCGGAYIKLTGGNIYLHAPGIVEHKGADHPFLGPTSITAEMPEFIKPILPTSRFSNKLDAYDLFFYDKFEEVPYQVFNLDGELLKTGTLDEYGRTDRIFSIEPEEVEILVGDWVVNEELLDQ